MNRLLNGWEKIFLVSDVAKALDISPSYVRILIDTGKIPALRSKGSVRLVFESEVLRYKKVMEKQKISE